MRSFILIIVLLSFFHSHSQVKISSFYFQEDKEDLIDDSQEEFESLLESFKTDHIQIIELNSFTSKTAKSPKALALKRTEVLLNQIDIDINSIDHNIFGSKREKVYFEIDNWDRIDIYYYQENRDELASESNEIDISTPNLDDSNFQIKKKVVEEKPEVTFGVPMVLPIEFAPGTDNVLKSSEIYLNQLVDSLSSNTFLYAHIRGHVCCGNNMRISKKRAKTVYKYLIKNGIAEHRLTFKGYSNKKPIIFPERTNEDRSTNRRVDVIFSNGTPYQEIE